MEEIWKDIKGYKNRYKVSNLGRVKSLPRKVINKNGTITNVQGKILKNFTNPKGYCLIALYINGKRNTCTVHRLILATFKGTSELEVNHIDGNKLNNKLINLEYVSNRENINHRERIINGKIKYGVHFSKAANKWAAKIEYKRKQIHLGVFIDKEEAHQAFYDTYLNLRGVAPW